MTTMGGLVLATGTAMVVVVLFARLAIEDARRLEVPVAEARAVTLVAVAGLVAAAVADGAGTRLLVGGIGAVTVTALQSLPVVVERWTTGGTGRWIGRADVRLAVPFGWTLGWFGLGFVVVGYAGALVGGLVTVGVTGRQRVPFVPFLAAGLTGGVGWALARQVVGGG